MLPLVLLIALGSFFGRAAQVLVHIEMMDRVSGYCRQIPHERAPSDSESRDGVMGAMTKIAYCLTRISCR
jgi:hypothetical protein